ncbi:MAG: hypothetical protein ACFFBU_04995 [Promethearchaeota archaeon]
MENKLPPGWMQKFLIVILLLSIAFSLIPTAFLYPALMWQYWYPPGTPQPLTTFLLSITMPLWIVAILFLILGYNQAKRFIHQTRESHQPGN